MSWSGSARGKHPLRHVALIDGIRTSEKEPAVFWAPREFGRKRPRMGCRYAGDTGLKTLLTEGGSVGRARATARLQAGTAWNAR